MGGTQENADTNIDSRIEDIRSRYDSVRGYFDAHVKHSGPALLFSNILSQPMSPVRTFIDLMDMRTQSRIERFNQLNGSVVHELEECERLIGILKRDSVLETRLWGMKMPIGLESVGDSEPGKAYLLRLSARLPLSWFLDYLEAYVEKEIKAASDHVAAQVTEVLKDEGGHD